MYHCDQDIEWQCRASSNDCTDISASKIIVLLVIGSESYGTTVALVLEAAYINHFSSETFVGQNKRFVMMFIQIWLNIKS